MAQRFPVELVIKAVDEATAPVRAIAAKINASMGAFKGLGGKFGAVGGALKNVGGAAFDLGTKLFAMSGAGAFAFYSIVHGAMEAGDKLGELSERTGLTVDAFAAMRFAAEQADVDQESFNGAIDQFNKRLGELKAGSGPILEFLNKVSPTLLNQVKAAKSTEQALSLMSDAFARIDDPAKSAALSAAMFGKSGLQMGRFMHQGSVAIQEQMRRYMELVGSQEASVRAAGELDNATRETGQALYGLRQATVGALMPALTSLAKTLTGFLAKNRDAFAAWATKAGAAIQAWLDSGGFERLVTKLGDIATAIGKVIDFLGPMGTAFAGLTVMALPLMASLAALVPVLWELGAALLPLGASLLPFIVAAAPFIAAAAGIAAAGMAIYENWGKLTFIFNDWWVQLKNIKVELKDLVNFLPMLNPMLGLAPINQAKAVMGGIETEAAYQRALAIPSYGQPGWAPKMNTEAARPGAALQSVQPTESRVSVDFSNLPKGARVSTDSNSSQPLDVTMGYSMAAP